MDSPAVTSSSASKQAPRPPGFLTFLKHRAVLPARNGALFFRLPVLTAALAAALLLGNALSVQPRAAAVLLDADAISRVDLATATYRDLVRALQSDLKRLLLAVSACLLGAMVAGSAVKIATIFATVAAFSSSSATDRRTTTESAALGSAKGNVWGPVLTVAFGYVLEVAYAAGIVALLVLAGVLLDYSPTSRVATGVACVLLLGAVEVFSVAAVTAYYFECGESVEEVEQIMAGHRYIKLPKSFCFLWMENFFNDCIC